MKIILFLLIFCSHICSAQNNRSKTELFIIGTIHAGNKHFDHHTIYKELSAYKPDVILWEQSTPFKKVWGLQTAAFLKIIKPGIEQLALQKYARRNKQIPILPFDTSFKSRTQYLKASTKMEAAFFDSLSNAWMNEEDLLLYKNYAEKRNAFIDKLFHSKLATINQPDVVATSRDLYRLERESIIPLAEKYIKDTSLVNAFINDLNFWEARNDFMVQQIQQYLKQFAGKRMLVLTGLNHKYYLLDRLSALENDTLQFITL